MYVAGRTCLAFSAVRVTFPIAFLCNVQQHSRVVFAVLHAVKTPWTLVTAYDFFQKDLRVIFKLKIVLMEISSDRGFSGRLNNYCYKQFVVIIIMILMRVLNEALVLWLFSPLS